MRRESPTGATGCSIPLHAELAVGTLRSILRQAKVELEEFARAL